MIPEIISKSEPISFLFPGANFASGIHVYLTGNSRRDLPPSVQGKLLPVQATAAKYWGKTLLAGLGASGGAGLGKGIGIDASASEQIAVSPNGNAAYDTTFAAPAAITGGGTYAWVTPSTKGLGFLGGAQFGVSNV